MILTNLSLLHKEMKKEKIKRRKYNFEYNNKKFDVIFFSDDTPFQLLIGVIGTRKSFTLDVLMGYKISTYLESDKLRLLLEILDIKYDGKGSFSTNIFFDYFNKNIPIMLNRTNNAKPVDIGLYKKVAEEADKLYFCGWFDNEKAGRKARLTNLSKTRELLGKDIYDFCKNKNISSCWSPNLEKEIDIVLP